VDGLQFAADDVGAAEVGQRFVDRLGFGEAGGAVLGDGVVQVLAQFLAHMLPQRIVWKLSLPVGPNGKLDRTALKAEIA